jgi:hypothetical protein
MSIIEFDDLIKSICHQYNIDEKDISHGMGYNSGYISQVRSRKEVPEKFINNMKLKYPVEVKPMASSVASENENPGYGKAFDPNYLVGIIKTQAEAILSQQKTIHELVATRA